MPDTVDDFAFALDAMQQVLAIVRERKTHRAGDGVIECPKCKGRLKWAFTRRPGHGRHSLDYAGQCETAGCISFRGH
jgi:hypothetical protein